MKERQIRALAEEAGCDVDNIDNARRHAQVRLTRNGVKGVVTISKTCCDIRFAKNVLADMKRIGKTS